jgi:hypothetical protein
MDLELVDCAQMNCPPWLFPEVPQLDVFKKNSHVLNVHRNAVRAMSQSTCTACTGLKGRVHHCLG